MIAKKALIVDDSRLAQFVLKKMLAAEKMDVDTTASAEEALDYLSRQQPDVIFLDHTMPGMNGLEALELIKDNPDTATIPVLMYTSQEDRAYMHQARELGAADVLPKELKSDQLQQALTRLGISLTESADLTQPTNDEMIDARLEIATEPATALNSDGGETLEQLVYDAEEALKYETWQQKAQQRFDDYRQKTDRQVSRLNERIENLARNQDRIETNKQGFWNNLLWLAIYVITVAIFAVIYLQQQDSITQLAQLNQAQANTNAAPRQTLPQPQVTPARPTSPSATAPRADTPPEPIPTPEPEPLINSSQLRELESIINTDNQVPYGEFLLGFQVQETLEEILNPLIDARFRGTINVTAHDGIFCVISNSSGAYVLAPDGDTVNQCQITPPSVSLQDIASDDFLRFVDNTNQTDNNIQVQLVTVGADNTINPYPEANDSVAAGEWNEIALTNRRVEVTFSEN